MPLASSSEKQGDNAAQATAAPSCNASPEAAPAGRDTGGRRERRGRRPSSAAAATAATLRNAAQPSGQRPNEAASTDKGAALTCTGTTACTLATE